MKAKTIWIIVGVVVLILIIANWNKIFGAKKMSAGGGLGTLPPAGGAGGVGGVNVGVVGGNVDNPRPNVPRPNVPVHDNFNVARPRPNVNTGSCPSLKTRIDWITARVRAGENVNTYRTEIAALQTQWDTLSCGRTEFEKLPSSLRDPKFPNPAKISCEVTQYSGGGGKICCTRHTWLIDLITGGAGQDLGCAALLH